MQQNQTTSEEQHFAAADAYALNLDAATVQAIETRLDGHKIVDCQRNREGMLPGPEAVKLVLLDIEKFGQQKPDTLLAQALARTPCIALYQRSPPPSLAQLSTNFLLRDLIAATAFEQIAFAIQRELETFRLLAELKQTQALLSNPAQHKSPLLERGAFSNLLDSRLALLHNDSRAGLALISAEHYSSDREPRKQTLDRSYSAYIASLLRQRIQPFDLLGQFPPATFALFSTRFSNENFVLFAEHLRLNIVENLFDREMDLFPLKCNIGISFWNPRATTAAELLTKAERAHAKAMIGDGNQIEIAAHQPGFATQDNHAHWRRAIESALKEKRFRLIFQPIVSLKEGGEENYAVLLRMSDRNGVYLNPDAFLPVAETTGLISAIDQWVLQQTIRIVKETSRNTPKRKFFLKISGHSLGNESIINRLEGYLKDARVNGKHLVFQINYAEYLKNLERFRSFVQHVKQLNGRIAIDHFGFGHYDLAQIASMDVDYIKIDGSLTRNLHKNPAYPRAIGKIQRLASDCGIRTVAKSVESANTLATLCNLGVDAVQGYFIQEPSESMSFSFPP